MAAADWSSLPPDFVRLLADVFLATTDLDYYMSLRAVCHDWRAATADPLSREHRFHPRRWIMLDADVPSYTAADRFFLNLGKEEEVPTHADGPHLFLNLDTGRFLLKHLPVIRNYSYLATADGLLVLQADINSLGRLCVLNPFTGSMVGFRASAVYPFNRSVAVAGSSPMALFSFYDFDEMAWVDQTCLLWPPVVNPTPAFRSFTAMAAFQGRVYTASLNGSVATIELDQTQQVTIIVDACYRDWERVPTFLVDNAGELLLVRVPFHRFIEVFRVDLDSKALVPVTSIGNRALFLGLRCSVSVDADRLPAIDANCCYYGLGLLLEPGVCRCHLGDNRGGSERSDERLLPHSGDMWHPIEYGRAGPMSLAHVLVCYCMGSGRLVFPGRRKNDKQVPS